METDLNRKARALEEAFYVEAAPQLQESLREMRTLAPTSGLLAEVSALADPQVLFRLAQLEVTPATAAALAILPLVGVAWSDGAISPAERRAIQDLLDQAFFFQTIDSDVVAFWLTTPPPEALMVAWESYVAELGSRLGSEVRKILAKLLLDQARRVADAAGGFLGFAGISPTEQAFLDRLAKALA